MEVKGRVRIDKQRKIFARNLTSQLSEQRKTQKELANALSVSPTVVNNWCKGIAIPRMGTMSQLAEYLNVPITELISETPHGNPQAEFKRRMNRYSTFLSKNPQYVKLFDAVAAVPAADVDIVNVMLDRFGGKE